MNKNKIAARRQLLPLALVTLAMSSLSSGARADILLTTRTTPHFPPTATSMPSM